MTKFYSKGTPQTRGYGTRYDRFTPNAIEKAVAAAPGMGYWNGGLRSIFCFKCQQTKPSKGHSKRNKMIFCSDCGIKKETA